MKTKKELLKDLKILRAFNKELSNLSQLLDKAKKKKEMIIK